MLRPLAWRVDETRRFFQIAFIGAALPMLTACGLADSHASWPELLRVKGNERPPAEEVPDVKRLVRENLSSVFVPSSNPHAVQVSPPIHSARGLGWIACVRAELTNTLGKPIGTQTYQITIESGVIIDRRQIDNADGCVPASYEAF
jgi:hypothetical protein